MRALWRLGGWGGAAALALSSSLFVSATDTGSQRLALAVRAEPSCRSVPSATVKMLPSA